MLQLLPLICRHPSCRHAAVHCALLATLFAVAPLARAAAPPDASTSPPSSDAVVVTGRQLAVETLIDRKVYSVSEDVQSSFGSAGDVLSAIPSVDVDADGAVSLRGDSHVLILIDGKPSSQLSGPAAGENLQSIPAADIERIEVMPNPPPQFKAQGAAGAINIITRRKRAQGVTGSLQASRGSGGRSVSGASVGYASGPLTAELSATYRQDYKRRFTVSELAATDPVTGRAVTNTSTTNETVRRTVPPVDLKVGYVLDPRDSLDAEFKRTGRAGLRTYSQVNDATVEPDTLTRSTERLSAGHDREIDRDERLGYTRKLGEPGETLELTLHASSSTTNEHYGYVNQGLQPPVPDTYSDLDFHELYATLEASLDYARSLPGGRALKAGYGFERHDYEYAAVRDLLASPGAPALPVPGSADLFRYGERIQSLYGSYLAQAGRWSALAGLRAEYTQTLGTQVLRGIATPYSYFALFPNLHVDRTLTERSTLSVGASRRVTRPDQSNYNPYVDPEYTPNLRAGNARLRPQFTQSCEFGWSYEGRGLSTTLTGYYRLNRDRLTDLTRDLGGGLTLTTRANLASNTASGLEFTLNGRITRVFSYAVSGDLVHSQIDATALGARGLASSTGVDGKVNLDFHPSPADSAQILVTRRARRLTAQGYMSAVNLVNLGYHRQLGRELAVVLTVSDVLNGQRFERIATTPTFVNLYSRRVEGRIAYVGLIYTFGGRPRDVAPGFGYDAS